MTLTFPHPVLTPITGKPDHSNIKGLKKQLYSNAREIHSTRGGGTLGHLGCIMESAEYVARAGVAYTIPPFPVVDEFWSNVWLRSGAKIYTSV